MRTKKHSTRFFLTMNTTVSKTAQSTPKVVKSTPKAVKPTPKTVKSAKSAKFTKPISGWTRCSGCWTTVRIGTTPSTCETCEKVANLELLACQCGSSELKVYRAKNLAARNCIRCIFLGHQDIRTAAQEEAMARYQVCSGVCGLVHPIGRTFCHDCQAITDVNPVLRKKLNDARAERRTIARDDRWNKTVWATALIDLDAQDAARKLAVATEKAAVEAASKALIDEQNEEENVLRILRFAQSGKARALGLPTTQVDATKFIKPNKTVEPVENVFAPSVPIVVLHPKRLMITPSLCHPESLAEFPLLGA